MDINPKISPTKVEVLKAEISSAIYLYFTNRNYVAIHLLVSAAHEIADVLCRKLDRSDLSIMHKLMVLPQDTQRQVVDKFRESYNFFKHANRLKEAPPALPISYTEILLLWVIYQYRAIARDWPWDMFLFVYRYARKNPELVLATDPGFAVVYSMLLKMDSSGISDSEMYWETKKYFESKEK